MCTAGIGLCPPSYGQSQRGCLATLHIRLLVRDKMRHFGTFCLLTTYLIYSLWLLNYEFADTILAISEDQVIFVLSPKKGKLLTFDLTFFSQNYQVNANPRWI